MQGNNFHFDDEAMKIIEDYLRDLDFDLFSESIQSLRDRWQRVVAA